jgi:MoxR-like ATPase
MDQADFGREQMTTSSNALNFGSDLEAAQVTQMRAIAGKVRERGMYGLDHVVNALVVALLTGGHVLLEGNPGLGKTALVRALSSALGLGSRAVGRIQFTPDLMPSDITGTEMPDAGQGALVFKKGPIFCNLLLADEINRATPKTQAAMLEAMAEYQVTVLGVQRPLREWRLSAMPPWLSPFMVMATQNPIDQDGTYPLPEAQSDRFMFKILMSMPDADVLGQIIDKEMSPLTQPGDARSPIADEPSAEAMERLHVLGQAIRTVPLLPVVKAHIVNIVQASNGHLDQVRGLSPQRAKALAQLVEGRITYPLGPRAAGALARGAVGWAAVALVDPADAARGTSAHTPQALAQIAVPVLRHRLKVQIGYGDHGSAGSEAAALDAFVRQLVTACAPDLPVDQEGAARKPTGYDSDFANAVERARIAVPL